MKWRVWQCLRAQQTLVQLDERMTLPLRWVALQSSLLQLLLLAALCLTQLQPPQGWSRLQRVRPL